MIEERVVCSDCGERFATVNLYQVQTQHYVLPAIRPMSEGCLTHKDFDKAISVVGYPYMCASCANAQRRELLLLFGTATAQIINLVTLAESDTHLFFQAAFHFGDTVMHIILTDKEAANMYKNIMIAVSEERLMLIGLEATQNSVRVSVERVKIVYTKDG